MTSNDLLRIRDLVVTYPGPPPVRAVDRVSFDVRSGECLGVVGESGSGKSTLARALLGLDDDADISGSVRMGDVELTGLDEAGWRKERWRHIALVFQSTTALNPVLRVDEQVAEPLVVHQKLSDSEARRRALEMLDRVGLHSELVRRHPHELSGGQRRLVLVAMALICDPEVVILDEPTAGLDVFTRRHLIDLLQQLRDGRGHSLVLLTHDLDAVADLADRVQVMYRGAVAETGPTGTVLRDPRHPYSFGLINSRPTLGTLKDLRGIRGAPPDPTTVASGCSFAERCTQAVAGCTDGQPPLQVPTGEDDGRLVACIRGGLVPVLEARGVHKSYHVRAGLGCRSEVQAVRGIDITVREGEVVGLVGPNGAGKSTLGRLLLRLEEADSGSIELEGVDLLKATGEELRHARRRAQMLFQDPYQSLSPRLTVREAVREPLDIQGIGKADERDALVADMLAAVRLPPGDGFLGRHTHELSGGQLQRVGLARALVLEPKLLVADEPLEGLDPSEQTKMLQLLKALQVERGMAMILVSHDLAVVLRTADRVVMLQDGVVVEEASGTELFVDPAHPLTRRMLAAAGRDRIVGRHSNGAKVEDELVATPTEA